MEKVFITDGNQRAALAIVRSLGQKKIPVCVGDHETRFLTDRSKWHHETFVYPSPLKKPEQFINELAGIIQANNIKVLIPVTDITATLILRNRHRFPGVHIPYPSHEAYEKLTDKVSLFHYASQCGVLCPQTYIFQNPDAFRKNLDQIRFPAVVKPFKSKVEMSYAWEAFGVEYANNVEELKQAYYTMSAQTQVLIQEKIDGPGVGLFTLYQNGEPIQYFSHERLRELPPSGGVSVYSQSIPLDANLKASAEKLLVPLKWTGLAMLEFKKNIKDGQHYLIEVNARPWGTMQLAVSSGVDFPYQLYQLALGKPVSTVKKYILHKKNRWLLGDLIHLRLVLKSRASFGTKMKAVGSFIISTFTASSHDVLSLRDPGPFCFELGTYWNKLMTKMIRMGRSFRVEAKSLQREKMKREIKEKFGHAKSVLFVCKGNICRSPFAERYAAKLFPHLKISSVGFLEQTGRPSPENGRHAAKRFGIDLKSHGAQLIQESLIRDSDLVFVFDEENEAHIRKHYPEAIAKTYYVGLLTDGPVTITDPFGGSMDDFMKCYERISQAINHLK
jgi:predicted ATP-grasp superfamily ATP-dependent carboligase/protein-tyrosine-phosphatase